jgi:hypothetical protein
MSQRTPPLTYLYGVVRAKAAPRIPASLRALPKMKSPHVIAAGERTWMVASDADPEAWTSRAIEAGLRDMAWVGACAAAHEGVVEALAKSGTVVPMKLFTLFASKDRALSHVTLARRQIERTFERIDGCDEWGVRVLFDPARAAKAATKRAAAATRGMSAGAGFLLRKKTLQDAEKNALARARDEAEELYDALGAVSKEARRRPPVRDDVRARALLDGVFLVPRVKATRLEKAAKKAASRLADEGFEVVVSGPWPAYHFVVSP